MKAELKNITLKMVPEGNDFHFYDTKNQQFIFHKQKGAPYGNIYQSFKGELSYLYFVKYTLNDKLPIILPNNYPKEVLKVGFSSKEDRNKRAKKSKEFMLPLTETQEIILEKDILSIIWIEHKIHTQFSYYNKLMRAALLNHEFSGHTEVYPFIQKEILDFIPTIEIPNWDYTRAEELYRQISIGKKHEREKRKYEKWKESPEGQKRLERRKQIDKAMKNIYEINNTYDCPGESASEKEREENLYSW